MRRLWVFRSDIRQLEYYHKYKFGHEMKEHCHDFYLMMGFHYLEKDVFDEVTIWRLEPPDKKTDVEMLTSNGKKFIQRFVPNFEICALYPSPEISFFRGGFKEYCRVTQKIPKKFGIKLYCGTGKRVAPQYGGIYDKVLVEDQQDLDKYKDVIPFYKTATPSIFHPIEAKIKYDICWPANFTQATYKGQDFFISKVAKSKYLKNLRIIHLGNKPGVGRKLARKHGVTNIEFVGWKERPQFNKILNQSKVGLCCSNRTDGCPRVVTEVLAAGTPLLTRNTTRLLDYYRQTKQVLNFNDQNVESRVKDAIDNFKVYKRKAKEDLEHISMDRICSRNIDLWRK